MPYCNRSGFVITYKHCIATQSNEDDDVLFLEVDREKIVAGVVNCMIEEVEDE